MLGADEMLEGIGGFFGHLGKGMAEVPALKHERASAALGHFPDYKEQALASELFHFDVCRHKWRALSGYERWALNQHFLDSMIEKRVSFLLATSPVAARPKSTFKRELLYLRKNGYWYGTPNLMVPPEACFGMP